MRVGSGNNDQTTGAQNAMYFFECAVVGGKIFKHAQANHMIKAGVWEGQ